MKKKVLIVANNMEVGGAERALLGLLDAFDTNAYSVDLFLLKHTGAFLSLISDRINILPENNKYSCLGVPILDVIKKGHFLIALGRCIGKIRAFFHIKRKRIKIQNSVGLLYSYKYTKAFLPKVSTQQYDLAIGFTLPYYIVAEKSIALKKAVWIHTDYTKEYADRKNEKKAWAANDTLVAVSQDVAKSFISVYPSLSEKVIVIHNIVSSEVIRQQSEQFSVQEEMKVENGETKILSIGRFCSAKNFENIPYICQKLVEMGANVKWFIIGFGNYEELIRKNIQATNMEEHVIILGKKDNPYPYIKHCDIYIQPSRVEGRCVTVTEAQILSKPVIITNYGTSNAQLRNGYDGIIVPLNNEDCAKGIFDVVTDKKVQAELISNTQNSNYSNQEEIEKLYGLIKEV